jgi:hypothetical protein
VLPYRFTATEAPGDEVWLRPAEVMLWKMDRGKDAKRKIVIFAAAQGFVETAHGASRLRADERCDGWITIPRPRALVRLRLAFSSAPPHSARQFLSSQKPNDGTGVR